MNKITKYSLFTVGSIVALMGAGACYVVATFDANTLKPRLSAWMSTEKQRTLQLNGPISLSFFPKLKLTLSDVELSERNAKTTFAKLSDVTISLQRWPLLSKRLIIDEVKVQGATINVVKNSTGLYNFADLLVVEKSQNQKQKEPLPEVLSDSESYTTPASTLPRFYIAQFDVTKSQINYQNQLSNKSLTFNDLSLFVESVSLQGVGRIDIKSQIQNAASAIDLKMATQLDQIKWANESDQLQITGFHHVIDGIMNDETFKLSLTTPKLLLTHSMAKAEIVSLSAFAIGAAGKIDTHIKLDMVTSDMQQVQAEALTATLAATQADTVVDLAANSTAQFNLASHLVDLPQLAIRGDVRQGDMPALPLTLSGNLNINVNTQVMRSVLKGELDKKPIEFSAEMNGFQKPDLRFAGNVTALGLDHYTMR